MLENKTLKNVVGVEIGQVNATNGTQNYNLPLFIATDKPSWLLDWNGSMTAIDALLKQIADIGNASTTEIEALETQIEVANNAINALTETTSKLTENMTSTMTDVSGLKTDVQSLQTLTTQMSSSLKELVTKVNELSATVTSNAENISNLSTEIGNFQTKVSNIDSVRGAIFGNKNGNQIDVSPLINNASSGALVCLTLQGSNSSEVVSLQTISAENLLTVGTRTILVSHAGVPYELTIDTSTTSTGKKVVTFTNREKDLGAFKASKAFLITEYAEKM